MSDVLGSEPERRAGMRRALMLGINFAVGMAVFAFVGFYIDQKRGKGCILFTILGVLLGVGYGTYEVWKVVRMLNEDVRKACGGKMPEAADEDSGHRTRRG
jgi:F0F1-type ATP synthase assembly protein I